MKIKVIERLDLGDIVTFTPNKDIPRYNWFYFKEGYSREFVMTMFKKFRVDTESWVLDPFMGSGTTLLACREKGVNGIGIDISPLFYMITEVKIRDYDINKLNMYSEKIFKSKFKLYDVNSIHPILKKAFNLHNLRDILFFRDIISEINDRKYRDFFLLALLNASSKVSLLWKEGPELKPHIRRHIPPFREIFIRVVRRMIRDIQELELRPSEIYLYQSDARRMTQIEDESIDFIITSPPYLNRIDYTRLYETEYLLTFGDLKINPIRSYIGLKPPNRGYIKKSKYIPDDIPPIGKAYFNDMYEVLNEMYRVLSPGGKISIVVGQGIFPDRVIDSDIIIAKMAYEIGFRNIEVWIVNKRIATKKRTKKIGVVNESIIIGRK